MVTRAERIEANAARKAEHIARLRDLAASGYYMAEAARKIGISPEWANILSHRNGIEFFVDGRASWRNR